MSNDTMFKISSLVSDIIYRDIPINDLSLFGGEVFLDLEPLKTLIRHVYDRDLGRNKNTETTLFISTNGSFVLFKDRMRYVMELLRLYGDNFAMRISNTIWHARQRSVQMQKSLERFAYVLDDPYDEEEARKLGIEDEIHLLGSEDKHRIYFDHGQIAFSNHSFNGYVSASVALATPLSHAVPIGRAKKTGAYDMPKYEEVQCFIPYYKDRDSVDLNLVIHWDGSIGLCCYGGGPTIANIHEIDSLPTLLLKRYHFAKKFTGYLGGIPQWKDCDFCRQFKLTG
jgi:hypothetical protein